MVVVGLTLNSCAVFNRPSPLPMNDTRIRSRVDSLLHRAELAFSVGWLDESVAVLKTIGWQGYSYNRMDETLYLLGRCRLDQADYARAEKCFAALRKYYYWCNRDFPDLAKLEQRVRAGLAANPPQPQTVEDVAPSDSVYDTADQPTVSNMFFESDLVQALSEIAEGAGVAIAVDPMVQGYVTAEFDQTPLEQAFDQMLTPFGFVFKKMEGYYLIGDPSPSSSSFPLIAETHRLELKYLKAGQVQTLMPDHYQPYLNIDMESNTASITAPPRIIRQFERDLALVDLPQEQFLIDVMVVELSSDAQRELGLDWDWSGVKDNTALTVGKLGNSASESALVAELLRTADHKWGFDFDLRTTLKALISSGKAKLKANPRLTAQKGIEASVYIGQEAYFSLVRGATGYAYNSLEKISTGVTLKLTPFMGPGSEITTNIYVEVSDVSGSGLDNLPVTSLRTVRTRVSTVNGETFGLGGLKLETKHKTAQRIPLLGELPLIGWLFGYTNNLSDQQEVVVLITPYVLINPILFEDL